MTWENDAAMAGDQGIIVNVEFFNSWLQRQAEIALQQHWKLQLLGTNKQPEPAVDRQQI